MASVKRKVGKALAYLILLLQSFLVLYPLYLMISTSLKPNMEIYTNPIGFPKEVFAGGYLELLKRNFDKYFINSLVITAAALVLVVVFGLLLSYAVARYRLRAGKWVYLYVLIGMMIPVKLGVLNLVDIMMLLGMSDTKQGLILVYIAMTIPFTVFILHGFISMIPRELDEAAVIDGCSTLGIIFRIVLPVIKPALVTVITYNFMTIWNDVYFPLVFLHGEENKTLALAVTLFFGQYSTDWNLTFSALTVAAVPTIIIYLVFSKWLVKGIMAGSVKG